jgi:antirestriction protein ArdC
VRSRRKKNCQIDFRADPAAATSSVFSKEIGMDNSRHPANSPLESPMVTSSGLDRAPNGAPSDGLGQVRGGHGLCLPSADAAPSRRAVPGNANKPLSDRFTDVDHEMSEKPMEGDIYTQVTTRIIESLEAGVRPWMTPWNAEHAAGRITRPLRHNGQPYSGINALVLWMEADTRGYTAPIWMTFRQARALGGHVRKGEKGARVIHANSMTKTEADPETGEKAERTISFQKVYTVFNVEQIDGLPARYYAKAVGPTLDPGERIAHVEAFIAATGAEIRHGGNAAYYTAVGDRIQMPPFAFFRDRESYYGTLLHETVHWTKSPERLDRDFGRKRWGDEGYAMEELVAEIGAAYLSADLGITPDIWDDHASYIASWLKVLREDKRAIFSAASHARAAATYLHDCQPETARAA